MSQSARIIRNVTNPKHRFCSLKLASGERIIVQTGAEPFYTIRVKKLIIGGLVFGPTIWEYNAQMAGGIQEYFHNFHKMFTAEIAFVGIGINEGPTTKQQLDIVCGLLIPCTSIDQVRHALLDRERLIHV